MLHQWLLMFGTSLMYTIISVSQARVSQARVSQLCFEKLFCSEIKLAISAALESGQNSSGASSGAFNFE